MNENSKTLLFVAVGAVALVGGWVLTQPTPPSDVVLNELNKEFFPEFDDPLKVASAEVLDLDSSTDTRHDLKVERTDGEWKINPEKQSYPDVSTERLADVVKAVIGLKKLAVVSGDRTKHREFGVVDPGSDAELKEGTEGVGKRIVLLDEQKRALMKLIVGKKADDKLPDLYYVRQPDRDFVYRTQVDAARLSSRFEDWAKSDLLGTGSGELRFAYVNDQSIDVKNMQQGVAGQGIMLVRKVPVRIEKGRGEAAKDADSKWQPRKFQTYDKEKKTFVDRTIAEDEELDSSKLADLGRALGNVKIVDAVRKPKLLAADLASDKPFLINQQSPVLRDQESAEALQTVGFFPNPTISGNLELICHEGEMTVGYANGVQYHLRFGDITGKGRGTQGEGDKKDGDKPADEEKKDGAAEGSNTAPNRYLMVTAAFNQDLIPKPKLTDLPPETPAADGGAAKPASSEKPATEKPATDAKPATEKPAPEKPAAEKPAEAPKSPTKVDADDAASSCGDADDATKSDDKKSADDKKTTDEKAAPEKKPAADDKPAAAENKPTAEAKPANAEKSNDAKTNDAKPNDAKKAPEAKPAVEAKPAAEAKPAETKPVEVKPAEVKPAMTAEERKRIETENKQKQEKYEADVKAGREKALELNKKFADWFYVVSDTTFQGLNVDPTTLIKKKPAPGQTPPSGPPGGGFPGLPPGLGLPPQP